MNYPTVNKKVIDWVVWLALTKIYTKFNMIFINMMMIWKKLYFQKPKWQHKKGSTKKFTLPFNMYYIDVIPYLNMGFVSFPTFFLISQMAYAFVQSFSIHVFEFSPHCL